MAQSDFVQKKISSLGPTALRLQVASHLLMNTARPTRLKSNSQNVIPKTSKVVESPKTETSTISQAAVAGSSHSAGNFDLLGHYKAELRARIDENKFYPVMSKRLGQTGTVVVAFTLLEDGNIINVRIEKPSRYERLNASALEAVKKVERFKPIPKEFGDNKMDVQVPVKFVTI